MHMDDTFLDVRNHGFARVAVVVPPSRLGDPRENARLHLESLRLVYEQGAQYAVCPELGLTGYSVGDLFFQGVLLEGALAALAELASATADWDLLFSVGMPLAVDGSLYNCAVTLHRGKPVAVAPKSYPPNYREFYELRWFQPAANAVAQQVLLLGETVPFGNDIVVSPADISGFSLHTDICEDIWVPIPPGTIAALSGATVLANLSASNITVGKSGYRRQLVSTSSAKNLAAQLYSAAGFGESTADLAWDGHGLIADRGDIIAETPRFESQGSSVVADIDLKALATDRFRQSSWGQNAAQFGRPMREVVLPANAGPPREAAPYRVLRRDVERHPYAPRDPQRLDERCAEVFNILSAALAGRIASLPEESRRAVIGISGGRDSTLALLVAAHAFDILKIPRSRIFGVTMPGLGTSDRTHDAACRLVGLLGATLRDIPVTTLSETMFEAIGHDPGKEDRTFENVQAWARKFVEFAVASEEGGIDLGTSDLSELALGWTTYGGDHMSHYGVNAGVPKTLVSLLIDWSVTSVFTEEPAVAETLRAVLAIPVSPELRRLSPEGEIVQLSEDTVGPYELHDFFLYYFTRFGFGPRRIARLALHAFDGQYELPAIKHWLEVFITRFFANQFKRDCLPDSPKVGSGGALSPRGDWRMPPDASAAAWLAELATVAG